MDGDVEGDGDILVSPSLASSAAFRFRDWMECPGVGDSGETVVSTCKMEGRAVGESLREREGERRWEKRCGARAGLVGSTVFMTPGIGSRGRRFLYGVVAKVRA
jgi:hypothetical protein